MDGTGSRISELPQSDMREFAELTAELDRIACAQVQSRQRERFTIDIGGISLDTSERQYDYFNNLFTRGKGETTQRLKEVLQREIGVMVSVVNALNHEFGANENMKIAIGRKLT